MVTKQIYVYSGFDVALCFSFHFHNHVKNVFKNVFYNVYDINVMMEKIGLLIRKIIENTLLYPIMS